MDYVFRPIYKSQVIPEVSEPTISFMEKYPLVGSWTGVNREQYLYDVGRWKHVMYDPTTTVESNFRRSKNIGQKPQFKK